VSQKKPGVSVVGLVDVPPNLRPLVDAVNALIVRAQIEDGEGELNLKKPSVADLVAAGVTNADLIE